MTDQTETLFRMQALHNHSGFHLGHIRILQAPGLDLMSLLALVIIGLISWFLYHGSYARKETVKGYLMPESGLVNVFAEGPGIVNGIYVKNNELVEKGQVLLNITVSPGKVDGRKPVDLERQELEYQSEALLKSIDQTTKSYEIRKLQLQKSLKSISFELTQSHQILVLHRKQNNLSQQKYAALHRLYVNGYLSELDWLSFKKGLIQQQQAYESARQEHAALDLKLSTAEKSFQQLPMQRENNLLQLKTSLSRIRQHQAELMYQQDYQIVAPVNGLVTSMQARIGQQIRNHFPQLAILPTDQPLIANLLITTRAIGFVKPGLPVNLLYDAFPYQHFGVYKGSVQSVSGSILASGEISGPVQIGEPAYIATVKLARQSIDAYGKEEALQPGMILHADIILENRSLIQWMLEPLYYLRGRT